MGNLLTVIVNAAMEEIAKKVRSLGYHSYNIDFENNFTIEGIRSNPKCKFCFKKSSVSADDLFVLENVSMEENNRFSIGIKIPKILLKIGKLRFTCTDPLFSCQVAGWIQISDVFFTLSVSAKMMANGPILDHINAKPKVSEIKSEIKLLVNKKDCSELANSLLCSKDPALLNFVLEFIIKSQEEPIREFINTQLQDAQKMPTFD